MTETAAGVAYRYDGGDWSAGPQRVYDRLAEAVVSRSPVDLAGALVLDAGAGTGAAGRAIAAAGGRPLLVDLEPAMLRHRPRGTLAAAADLLALPLRDGAAGAAVAAFVLNHLTDPSRALGEMRRVTRAGGAVLAATFSRRNDHPAKAAVEGALRAFGYVPQDWYLALKQGSEPLTADPASFARAATAAGLDRVAVAEVEVDTGVDDPAGLAAWRLGLPTSQEFLRTLDPEVRRAAVAAAEAAVGARPPGYVATILVLSSRAPA